MTNEFKRDAVLYLDEEMLTEILRCMPYKNMTPLQAKMREHFQRLGDNYFGW